MKIQINVFVAVLLVSFFTCHALNAETITIAAIDFCPYECDPAKEQGKLGYTLEISKAIFEKEGIEVKILLVPWKRSLVGTEDGDYDAVPLINTAHSKVIVLSKERSSVLQQPFFVKKGNPWRYNGVQSLENIVVGTVLGYNATGIAPEYQRYLDNNRTDRRKVEIISGINASLRIFKMIKSGRITTFTEDAGVAKYMLTKETKPSQPLEDMPNFDDFEVAGSLGENIQYMGFSPKNPNTPKYVELFDQGIRSMRENGELKKILDSYGIEDWEN